MFLVFVIVVALSRMPAAQCSPLGQRFARGVWPFSYGSSEEFPTTSETLKPAIHAGQAPPDWTPIDGYNQWIWRVRNGIDAGPMQVSVGQADPAVIQDRDFRKNLLARSAVAIRKVEEAKFPKQTEEPSANEIRQSMIRQESGYPAFPQGLNPASTLAPIDLTFLDDLGGLAAFLPDPEDYEESSQDRGIGDQRSPGSVRSVTSSLESEESPGFLWWLLSKLTFGLMGGGAPAEESTPLAAVGSRPTLPSPLRGLVEADNNNALHRSPTYRLPHTKSTYVTYRLPVNEPAEIVMTHAERVGFPAGPVERQVSAIVSQDTEGRSFALNNAESGGSTGFEESPADGSGKIINDSMIHETLDPQGHEVDRAATFHLQIPEVSQSYNAANESALSLQIEPDAGKDTTDTALVDPLEFASTDPAPRLSRRQQANAHASNYASRLPSNQANGAMKIEGNAETASNWVKSESTSPRALIAQPVAQVATTYSRVRKYSITSS